MSQIESGKSNINVALLMDIAKILDLSSVAILLDDVHDLPVEVIHKEEKRSYMRNEGNVTIDMLFSTPAKELEASIIHLPVGSDTKKPVSHRGNEFCYVIKGKVELSIENWGNYVLEVGDVASYQAELMHKWRNIGDEECEVLVACTPASF